MSRPQFPRPEQYDDWRDYAQALEIELTRQIETPEPSVVLLPSLTPKMSAAVDGLLAFDRTAGAPVVSVGGVWRQIALVP